MDKASKAFRRSGVRIRSAGSGHTDLQLIISELKEIRAASKWFQSSQSSALEDFLKWALHGENRAIQETASHMVELNAIWSDVQNNFADQLKEFRKQFELILEGEKQVDNAKQRLTAMESKESKLRKELKKFDKKCVSDEVSDIRSKLKQAQDARILAQNEVTELTKENEAVKLIRLKQGFRKLSESYLEMAHKCIHVFEAQKDIINELPDVHNTDIHSVKYSGSIAATSAVFRAKERVDNYNRNSVPLQEQAPPPYNPHFVGSNCRSSNSFSPNGLPSASFNGSHGWNATFRREASSSSLHSPTYPLFQPSQNPFDEDVGGFHP